MTDRSARGGSEARGRVVLIGAGPGHPGLLTLRGAEMLGAADVVLYDELASPELLDLARPDAECVNVGKRGHDAPTREQPEINRLMVEHAAAGRMVVRLKGGDPFVFGRGGEELSACRAAGIDFEVVPGVSSALAAPAFAGIPVTDRRHAASFAVVTGHKDPSRASEQTRWAELGRAVDTLIVLMGMRNLRDLVQRLIDGGKDPETPAAAVMHGTLPRQRVVASTLSALPDAAEAAGLGAPSAIVVGEVVDLRESLAWWEQMPLFGRHVLVPRAPEQSGEMVGALRAAGAQPVAVPLIGFGPPEPADAERLRQALGEIDVYDAVVFASSNAVRFTAEAARAAGVDLAAVAPRFACVGRRTADALLDRGLPVHCVAGGGRGGGAEALLEVLSAAVDPRDRRFLLPRSQLGRDTLASGLREAGAQVDALTAYRTLRPEIDARALNERIAGGEIDVLTFTSPSTLEHLLEVLDEPARQRVAECTIAAIGETTARALRRSGIAPDVVPEQPDGAGLVEALAAHFAGARR